VLKKIPAKIPDEHIDEAKQPNKLKFKPEPISKPSDDKDFTLNPFKPLPFSESPEVSEIMSSPENIIPKDELPTKKTKYVRNKPKKENELSPERQLILGIPKPVPNNEDKDIKLKYKQRSPEPKIPEEIKLKPFPKKTPVDEKTPGNINLGRPEPNDYPRGKEEIKPKHYRYKP